MITLTRKLKKETDVSRSTSSESSKRVSVRDKLLIKERSFDGCYSVHLVQTVENSVSKMDGEPGLLARSPVVILSDKALGRYYSVGTLSELKLPQVQEMEQTLPNTCRVKFENPDTLHDFNLTVMPDEGFWCGGRFCFHIYITEDYNMAPPTVKCLTKLWHPNISEEGDICLSLLRQNSIDGMGWAPTRKLKDVIWGLNSLFTDLLNFDDPLNIEAAELYTKDKEAFRCKVREYVTKFAKR